MAKSVVDAARIKGAYQNIEHTADIGIAVTGKTLEEVFALAAGAMFDIMVDVATVEPIEKATISLQAENLDELLVAWLNELAFRSEVNGMFFSKFQVESVTETSLQATAMGEPYDQGKHSLGVSVKAATYHELKISRSDGGWSAQVIFDV
jgi:SHS2 domain-containing protein